MKSIFASQRTLKSNLSTGPVFLVLLDRGPEEDGAKRVDYQGSGMAPISGWKINGRTASNEAQITIPRNKGPTKAKVGGWAIVDENGQWIYGDRVSEPFDIRPNDEPYFMAGDIVVED